AGLAGGEVDGLVLAGAVLLQDGRGRRGGRSGPRERSRAARSAEDGGADRVAAEAAGVAVHGLPVAAGDDPGRHRQLGAAGGTGRGGGAVAGRAAVTTAAEV